MMLRLQQTLYSKTYKLAVRYRYIGISIWLYFLCSTFTFAQLDSLEQLLPSLPANEEKVDVLNELSYLYHRQEIQKTFSYANEGLALARKINYTKGRAYAIHYLSIANSISGDNELSKVLNIQAIHLADSIKAYKLLIGAYNVKAFVLTKEGKPEEAVEVFQLALDIAIQQNDKKGIGSIKMNMGETHARNGDLASARDYYQSAIKMAKEYNKLHTLAWGYGLMADTYFKEKEYEKASDYLKKSLKISEDLNDIRTTSYAKSRLAKVYLETGKIKSAQQQSLAAIELIKKVGDKEVLAEEYIHLIAIYLKGNQPNKAIETGQKGVSLTKEINSIQQQLHIQGLLAEAYAKMKNYEKAYALNTLNQGIKDSLDLSAKKNLASELEEKYKSKKKEAENALLRAEQEHQTIIIAQQKSANFFLIIVALLLALLGYVAFSAYRNKRRNNLLLEEKVAARTIELQKINTQLVQSNEELSRFAYVASHDLREPLRNISNFTQLLRKALQSNPNQEVLQFMDIIHKNITHMNNLIVDTLAFTQLSNKTIKKTAVNINQTIKNIKSSIINTLENQNVTIQVQQVLPTVYANEGLLFSVFKNLIENGITYNESKSPIICINYSNQGKEYLFSVKDNGIGIPEAYQDTIFKMFKRLHNRNKYEGSGMGLANCKKIIDKLGGKIWVESDGQNGSTFFFTLPISNQKQIAKSHQKEMVNNLSVPISV